MACSALSLGNAIYCAAAGSTVTVAEARQDYHYRGGDLSGDYPVGDPRHTPALRAENTRACSCCDRCMD